MNQRVRKPAKGITGESSDELGDLIIKSIDDTKILPLVVEYGELNLIKTRTEKEDDRLQEILDEACENGELSFWIFELNHILGHFQNQLSYEYRRADDKSKEILRDKFLDIQDKMVGKDFKEIRKDLQHYINVQERIRFDKECKEI
jgi:hypothetical protein